MYESRFVEKPFRERVDGRDCVFDDMDFINGVKSLALEKGYELAMVEKFIASNEGWWGIYGEYGKPTGVIAAYEQKMNSGMSKLLSAAGMSSEDTVKPNKSLEGRVIPKEVVEELGLTDNELNDLSKYDNRVVDFVLGLKRLSKDTGVTIAGGDGDCTRICMLPTKEEIKNAKDPEYIPMESIAVITPRKLEFSEFYDRTGYRR